MAIQTAQPREGYCVQYAKNFVNFWSSVGYEENDGANYRKLTSNKWTFHAVKAKGSFLSTKQITQLKITWKATPRDTSVAKLINVR